MNEPVGLGTGTPGTIDHFVTIFSNDRHWCCTRIDHEQAPTGQCHIHQGIVIGWNGAENGIIGTPSGGSIGTGCASVLFTESVRRQITEIGVPSFNAADQWMPHRIGTKIDSWWFHNGLAFSDSQTSLHVVGQSDNTASGIPCDIDSFDDPSIQVTDENC